MDGPVDNLVSAFAIHLEACSAAGCAAKTISVYEQRYKRFLTFLKEQGHTPPFELDLLNAPLVRRSAIWTRENTRSSRGGNSAATYLVASLKTCSGWLADEGYLPDGVDPLARVKRPKSPDGTRVPFTQEDVRSLISATVYHPTGTRDAALIMLLLDTGMRIGGAISILRDDLELRERRVVLRLKGGRQHTLYFGSSERRDGGRSARAMRSYVTERDETITRWLHHPRGDRSQGRLFLSYDGWPLTVNGWHQALVRIGREAGLRGVFPHRFRHTFATWYLVRHPGDETGLRGILGHLSDDMFRVYTHLAHEIVAQRAGRVALSEAWLGDDAEARAGPGRAQTDDRPPPTVQGETGTRPLGRAPKGLRRQL